MYIHQGVKILVASDFRQISETKPVASVLDALESLGMVGCTDGVYWLL